MNEPVLIAQHKQAYIDYFCSPGFGMSRDAQNAKPSRIMPLTMAAI